MEKAVSRHPENRSSRTLGGQYQCFPARSRVEIQYVKIDRYRVKYTVVATF